MNAELLAAKLDECVTASRLIIIGCSAAKRTDQGGLKAIDRYDGPMWRTLRARLTELPAARAALASGDLAIWVLSARYGFIPADVEVPDYDQRLTAELAGKMARDPSYDFQRIPHFVDSAEQVLFAGGDTYRTAMWKASGVSLWNITKIAETDGAAIGHHRAQLGEWMRTQFADSPERLAA